MLQKYLNFCKWCSLPFLFLGIFVGCCYHNFKSGMSESFELVIPPDGFNEDELTEVDLDGDEVH